MSCVKRTPGKKKCVLCSSVSFIEFAGVWAVCDKQAALSITAPLKMEALSGSCLLIPCNFTAHLKGNEQLDTGEIFGVWIKSDSRFHKFPSNVIFNSSKTNNTYPMALCGELKNNNCSTLFSNLLPSYTDTYYFRIEAPKFKATASCHPLQIAVRGKRGLLVSLQYCCCCLGLKGKNDTF